MANMPLTVLSQALIFTGDAFVEGHALVLQQGKVLDIVPSRQVPVDAISVSCQNSILAPGFIDCQVNGGSNILFNDNPSASSAIVIAQSHAKMGTTRILPTCISDTNSITQQAVLAARQARQEYSGILGIHLEGPHLSQDKRGVHHAVRLRDMSPDDLKLYQPSDGDIMLITVAPERVTPEQIHQLVLQGVKVSLGHTGTDMTQIRHALYAGATAFTHLFNGMGGMSARMPGPAGVALDDRDAYCSLIADGFHVSAEMIRLALRAKPPGKVFLVSDAMPPAATDKPEPFKLYNEEIKIEGKRLLNRDRHLAGCMLTLVEQVQLCVKQFDIEPIEALRMASLYPATYLGLEHKYGKLLPGYTADIVALTHDFMPLKVWFEGNPLN